MFSGLKQNEEREESNELEIRGNYKIHYPNTGPSSAKRVYKCDVCYKVLTRSDSLRRHRRLHTGEKPYTCGTCEKQFSDGGNFLKHLRQHGHVRLSDKESDYYENNSP